MESGHDKTGVATGIHALHPLTGEMLPVWVADYVLGSYGTGAIMAVPAHDGRDFAFAQKFGLAVKQVIRPADGSFHDMASAYEDPGVLVNSGPYNGKTSAEAAASIARKLHDIGMGGAKRTYKLRDWVLSRQRYWGVPIPIIYCRSCWEYMHAEGMLTPDVRVAIVNGTERVVHSVPDKDLPVKLPPLKDFKHLADIALGTFRPEQFMELRPRRDDTSEVPYPSTEQILAKTILSLC